MRRRFAKANTSGTGRRPGSNNTCLAMLDQIARENIGEIIRKVTETAEAGNRRAAALLRGRTRPNRPRGRMLSLNQPPIETVDDIVQAQAAVVAHLAAGDIAPNEASTISAILESQRRALAASDLEKRLQEVEKMARDVPRPSPGAT